MTYQVSLAGAEVKLRLLAEELLHLILEFGFTPEETFERACEIAEIQGVSVNGLMCVAPICEKESEIRSIFSNMHQLFIDIRDKKTDNKRSYLHSFAKYAGQPGAA